MIKQITVLLVLILASGQSPIVNAAHLLPRFSPMMWENQGKGCTDELQPTPSPRTPKPVRRSLETRVGDTRAPLNPQPSPPSSIDPSPLHRSVVPTVASSSELPQGSPQSSLPQGSPLSSLEEQHEAFDRESHVEPVRSFFAHTRKYTSTPVARFSFEPITLDREFQVAINDCDYAYLYALVDETLNTGELCRFCPTEMLCALPLDAPKEHALRIRCLTLLENIDPDEAQLTRLNQEIGHKTICRYLHDGECRLLNDLLRAAVQRGAFDQANEYIAHGASVDAIDAHGNTTLHHAVYAGDEELALYLLSQGARSDILNKDSKTAADMINLPGRPAHYVNEWVDSRLMHLLTH